MTLLTLDLGTSVLKAALWKGGKLVAGRAATIPLRTEGTIAEQDPNTWWKLAVDLIRDLAPEQIDGIGITAQMHAIVPIDAEGKALTPVPIVMDRRAQAEVDELNTVPGWRAIHEITGGRLDVTCVLPKLRHLTRSAEGDAWRDATWLLPPKDFLRFQLTGIAASDPIDAAGTLLWNINTKDWDQSLIDLAGISANQLPPVQPTLSIAGKLTDQAAQALGLYAGIPIVTGGGDDIETLGAGVLTPGDFFEHCGTTGSLYLATDQFILDPTGEVETYPDIVPGRWIMGASTTTAGAALAWARRVLALDEESAPKNGLPKLEDTPGDLLFLPFLAGERGPWWNASLTGSWSGMRPEHTAADLYRAAVEGVFFSLHSLQVSLQTHAPTTDGMVHTSGPLGLDISGAQARADLYGRDVRRRGALPQSTAFAAAIITEATLTNTDPYELADQRLETVWTCSPSSNQAAWAEGAQRYHQAALAAHNATQSQNTNS
jgi:xylulokinase